MFGKKTPLEKIAICFLLVIICFSVGIIGYKIYHNHNSAISIINDNPRNPYVKTIGEQISHYFLIVLGFAQGVLPEKYNNGDSAMAYYLYYNERLPSDFKWTLGPVVQETGTLETIGYYNGSTPVGSWAVDAGDAPAPTVTDSGSGYLVAGAGTAAYNGGYGANGNTCNGEPVYELGYLPEKNWEWEVGMDAYVSGGFVWGQENVSWYEAPLHWSEWSDGSGGSVTVSGDGSWGKIQLGQGEVAHSPVKDFDGVAQNISAVGLAQYGDSPLGDFNVYYRESDTVFAQDDETPAWTEIVIGVDFQELLPMTLRYRQLKLEGV